MPEEIDTTTPHSPRVWNYWLGGKDNYAPDREVGDHFRQTTPQIVDLARSSRAFLVRAITHLAGECGVRQFLDIGTGLPTANNTHEVAQRRNPAARIVYVDNDPVVLAHARALLTSSPEGATRYLDADFRDPGAVLAAARDTGILDFDEPIALILMNIVGHIEDWEQARGIVATYVDALPAGSYLVESDGTNVIDPASMNDAARIYNATANPKYNLRGPDEIAQLFSGLQLLDPGVVTCPRWRPELSEVGTVYDIDQFGGVGRKP
ncbi:S-adenosyl methyltransferase [Pseudonocardia sp. CNS-004]|nr:S-adenosyl methyltransferase [Pseudonocardia sp. CNS-004]